MAGEATGYDVLDKAEQSSNEDYEDQLINSTSLFNKVVTSQPISSSLPSVISNYRRLSRSPGYHDDEEAQLLLPTTGSYQSNSSLDASPRYTPTTPRNRPKRSLSILSLGGSINNTVSRWTHSLWPGSSKVDGIPNEIQFSVFKPPSNVEPLDIFSNITYEQHKIEFLAIVEDSIKAINQGISKPKRIAAGSSGSYFIYNTQNEIVGVFKPKDEEPYGPLSPKWTKWVHRNLFPCFFGRSCLIPNNGYICESAASLLDGQLQTNIVPFTDVVSISSDSFYYSYWDRRSNDLPPKIGSFQIFLNDYMEADKFFAKYPLPGSGWSNIPAIYQRSSNIGTPFSDYEPAASDDIDLDGHPRFKWTPEVLQQFREELEKLVILDYIMRNTDRGLDNWMIHIEWRTNNAGVKYPYLKIGAIDSGLSWPWKHPDEWRSYPFGWLFLPVSMIGQPFSENTRKHFLSILTSTKWWEESSVLFRHLFTKDSEFKERMWKKQWAIMKGQAFNVVETLKTPTHGPLELARRSRVIVHDEEMEVPVHIPISLVSNAIETPITGKKVAAPINLESINEEGDDSIRAQSQVPYEEQVQRNWDDLLNGNIEDAEFKSPSKRTRSDRLDSAGSFDASASKRVIIERLQTVTSKPPVFTWC